jgi:hypothetical protein
MLSWILRRSEAGEKSNGPVHFNPNQLGKVSGALFRNPLFASYDLKLTSHGGEHLGETVIDQFGHRLARACALVGLYRSVLGLPVQGAGPADAVLPADRRETLAGVQRGHNPSTNIGRGRVTTRHQFPHRHGLTRRRIGCSVLDSTR